VKLLADKLTFAPERRNGCEGFRFQARGTVAKLVAGSVPGRILELQAMASPRGTDTQWTIDFYRKFRAA
jgi:hypothetical protein